MAAEIMLGGVRYWAGGIDAEGHRYYKLRIRTKGGLGDGPASHMSAPGLPVPGSQWLYENTPDPWAWCDGADDCTPVGSEDQRATLFDHSYTYSTRPRGDSPSGGGGGGGKDDRGDRKKCADQTIQDPLSEPPRTSGGFIRYQEEAQVDKDNLPILNGCFEPIKGPAVERDRSRDTVTVEQNVADLEYSTVKKMIDTLNDATLWTLPARCWKLSEFHWERKLYGTCFFYYTRRFVFESLVRLSTFGGIVSGWDKQVLDEGSKALHGKWVDNAGGGVKWSVQNFRDGTVPDPAKPTHFMAIPSPPPGTGNIRMYLKAGGVPAESAAQANIITVQFYKESNFLTLGIPTVL